MNMSIFHTPEDRDQAVVRTLHFDKPCPDNYKEIFAKFKESVEKEMSRLIEEGKMPATIVFSACEADGLHPIVLSLGPQITSLLTHTVMRTAAHLEGET